MVPAGPNVARLTGVGMWAQRCHCVGISSLLYGAFVVVDNTWQSLYGWSCLFLSWFYIISRWRGGTGVSPPLALMCDHCPGHMRTNVARSLLWSKLHTTARLHNDYDKWSKTTQPCSVWPTIITYMLCCCVPVMTDRTTTGGHEPVIMHLASACEKIQLFCMHMPAKMWFLIVYTVPTVSR